MIERIEIEHNKKVTVLISLIHFIIAAGFVTCVTLIWIHFEKFSDQIGMDSTVLIMVVLALCIPLFFILFVNQVIKFRHKYIFLADENGICDHSRFIALKPISYDEICEKYKHRISFLQHKIFKEWKNAYAKTKH